MRPLSDVGSENRQLLTGLDLKKINMVGGGGGR